MNALAVEIAAREGARIVWMPTVDSPAETAGRTEPKDGDKVPQWARLQHELREPRTERRRGARHRSRRGAPARDARRAASDRQARADPRDGPPRTRRHVRGRRRGARGGRRRHRRHASGVPVPELLDRGPAGARRAGLPPRALSEHSLQREDDVGARLRRRARGRRSSTRSSRATAETRTIRRSRTGSRSGPTASSAPGSTRTRCAR